MFRKFKHELKDSKPEDCILLSGLTIMTSIACSVFAKMHGRVNILIYDEGRGKDSYVKRTIMMEDL